MPRNHELNGRPGVEASDSCNHIPAAALSTGGKGGGGPAFTGAGLRPVKWLCSAYEDFSPLLPTRTQQPNL